jgi:hypothetical protein
MPCNARLDGDAAPAAQRRCQSIERGLASPELGIGGVSRLATLAPGVPRVFRPAWASYDGEQAERFSQVQSESTFEAVRTLDGEACAGHIPSSKRRSAGASMGGFAGG